MKAYRYLKETWALKSNKDDWVAEGNLDIWGLEVIVAVGGGSFSRLILMIVVSV